MSGARLNENRVCGMPKPAEKLAFGTVASSAGRRLYHFVAEPLGEADGIAKAHLLRRDKAADLRLLAIVLLAALAILIQHYVLSDDPSTLLMWIWSAGFEGTARRLHSIFADPLTGRFNSLLLWATGIVVCYLVLPALVLKLSGARLGDYGLRFGPRGDVGIYAAIFILALPLVLLAARQPAFLSYYPFYKPPAGEPLWPRFLIFELFYVLHFVAVEFLFRGVLIHGVKHRAGAFAILFPLIPYMMIHFGKPMIECAGAVFAGLFLGFMSLRTGSIVYGIVLHVAVAITMDMVALTLQGRLL